ncbi:MAG: TetR/AcrR family transcriptional regulator [Parvularculaceae bacterium]|nr:TetR/AcrR family transcriptional regulator [Parvularculaceae bacterium]
MMISGTQSYIAQLARRLETDPPKRKGDRTRERLKLAAATVLDRCGFFAMRVTDITEAAGASEGTFYIYFKDKNDITLEILREFLFGIQNSTANEPEGRDSPFNSIRESNLLWLKLVRNNAGLMRCVFQVSDDDPAFSRLVHASNRSWYERIARSVVRHNDKGAVDFPTALFAAWSLGAMMDEFMRRMLIYPDEAFVAFLGEVAPSDEALADALSVIWLRVLYPSAKAPTRLAGLARKLSRLSASEAGEFVSV